MRATVQGKIESKRKLPEWITCHFRECLDTHQTLMQIIHISERGIGVLRGMPKIVKVLADVEVRSKDPKEAARLEAAEKEALLAQTEITKGFPILHGLAVVALWSWLEHFVKGFLALWLLNRRDALSVTAVRKLRIKLGEYLQVQKAEQGNYLVRCPINNRYMSCVFCVRLVQGGAHMKTGRPKA
ncbi:MAG: hypothetical protein K0S45_3763, partial [Nitrospira sp.]|nr:hypothetical protein [Nitrospira sp.]